MCSRFALLRSAFSRKEIDLIKTKKHFRLNGSAYNLGSAISNNAKMSNSNVSGGGNCEAISDGAGVSL
jgi:hypothetical protein